MSILPLILGTLSGICIATGIIFLFSGLRRPGRDRVQLLFALFAFSYAGANLTSVLEYKTNTLEEFMRMGDWTALFTILTLLFLLWFVSAYTKVAPRIFLYLLTLVLGLVGIIAVSSPTSVHAEVFDVVMTTLPWGETITQLDASEGIWEIVFFLGQLTVIGFLIFACVRQYLRGERQNAFMLGFGLLFLILALIFDMLFIDSRAINFIYLGDFGFIPLLVIMSLQLSNQVIRADKELATYRENLEQIVSERTQELEDTATALRQSERQSRALLDAPSDTAMLVTLDGFILDTNQVGASRLGLMLDNARGKNVFELIDPELGALRKGKAQELIVTKQPIHWEDQRGRMHFSNHMYPVLDDTGEVASIAVYARDITDQKRSEKELQQHVADLNRLIQITAIITTQPNINDALQQASERIVSLFQARYTHIIYASTKEQNLEVMSGFDVQIGPLAPQLIGYQLDQLPRAKEVMENGQSIIIDDLDSLALEADVKTYLTDNHIKQIMLVPLFVKGKVIGVLAVSGDNNRAAFEPNELNLLEAIAGFVATAIENARLAFANVEAAAVEERGRLARDLHDAVTQTIYAASLIAESLPQVWARNPDEGQRNLIKLRQLVRGALAEMRSLLFELRPSSLETASMDTLIQFIADAFTGRTRVPVTMRDEGYGEVPADVKTAFYRITQEVFNNIAKHAEATSVKIDLEGSTKRVALAIQDSGVGFDPRGNDLTGMGLSIMRERAAAVGAQLEIESQMGQGTKVTLTWMEPNQENLNE